MATSKKGLGGSRPGLHTDRRGHKQSFPHNFLEGFAALAPQFLVLTLGGAIVSFSFQYFGKARDEALQEAKFRTASFLEIRAEADRQITNRLVVMERISSRLSGNDFLGAKRLKEIGSDKEPSYGQVVQEWNVKLNRLLSPMKRLGGCHVNGKLLDDRSQAFVFATTHDAWLWLSNLFATRPSVSISSAKREITTDCLLDYFSDSEIDQPQIHNENDYVKNPRSVHFAFRNAGVTLSIIFKSAWADCQEATAQLHERRLQACKKEPQDSDQATRTDDISSLVTCVRRARDALKQDLNQCNNMQGSELVEELKSELEVVRKRWGVLSERFLELEKLYGTYDVPDFGSSPRNG